MMAPSLGKMPTTSARRFTSLFRRSNGFVEWILVSVRDQSESAESVRLRG